MSTTEYEVLTDWIDAEFTGKERVDKKIAKVVIFDATESGDDDLLDNDEGQHIPWEKTADSVRKQDPVLQQTTLDAFRKVNVQQAMVARFLRPAIDYEIVSSSQVESIFCKGCGNWDEYYKRFPNSNGILTFSRVGFSADSMQAFFYLSNRCGGLCGGGRYVVMEKHNGRWAVQNEIEMWIS